MWRPSISTENIRLSPVLMNRESVPTASCSPVSPFLRFVVTEPSRMKSVRTEGCHVGLIREFVGTACCTYGQSNTTYYLSTSLMMMLVEDYCTMCTVSCDKWWYNETGHYFHRYYYLHTLPCSLKIFRAHHVKVRQGLTISVFSGHHINITCCM